MDLEGAREINHFQANDGAPLPKRLKVDAVTAAVAGSPALAKLLRTDSPSSSTRSGRHSVLLEDGRLTLESVLSRGSNKGGQLMSSASPSAPHSLLHNTQQSLQRGDSPLVASSVLVEGDDPPPLQQLSQSAPGSGRNSPASARYSSRPGSPYVVLGPGQGGRHLSYRPMTAYPPNGSPVAEAGASHASNATIASSIAMPDGRRIPVAEVLKELHQYGIVNTMYKSGVCMWPNCLELCASVPAFACHIYSQHGLGHQTSAQLQVQGAVVQHLQQIHAVESQRLAAMTAHLQILATAAKSAPQPSVGSGLSDSLRTSEVETPVRSAAYIQQHWHQEPTEVHTSVNRLPTMPALLSTNHRIDQPPQPRVFSELASRHSQIPAAIVPRPGVSVGHALTMQSLLTTSEPVIEITAQDLEFYRNSEQRPPFTYAALIRAAIMSSSKRQLTLYGIYNWLSTHFRCFDENSTTWKNAVRHNLSLHKYFKRIDLENHKGGVWMVDDLLYWSKRKTSRSVTEDGKLKAEVRNSRQLQFHRDLQRRHYGSSLLLQQDKPIKDEPSSPAVPPTQLTPTKTTTGSVENALETVVFMPTTQGEMEETSDVETVQVHYVTQPNQSDEEEDNRTAGLGLSSRSRKALRPMRVNLESAEDFDEDDIQYSSLPHREQASSPPPGQFMDQEETMRKASNKDNEEELVVLARGSPDDDDDEGGLVVDEDVITASDQEN